MNSFSSSSSHLPISRSPPIAKTNEGVVAASAKGQTLEKFPYLTSSGVSSNMVKSIRPTVLPISSWCHLEFPLLPIPAHAAKQDSAKWSISHRGSSVNREVTSGRFQTPGKQAW